MNNKIKQNVALLTAFLGLTIWLLALEDFRTTFSLLLNHFDTMLFIKLVLTVLYSFCVPLFCLAVALEGRIKINIDIEDKKFKKINTILILIVTLLICVCVVLYLPNFINKILFG